jgi:uncharacterized repeat protein (TIGR03803 family)
MRVFPWSTWGKSLEILRPLALGLTTLGHGVKIVTQRNAFRSFAGKEHLVRLPIPRAINLICIISALTIVLGQVLLAQTFTVLHNFTLGEDGGVPVAGLARDAAGNLYGTATQGGSGGVGTVFRLTTRNSQWVFTSMYGFKGGLDGSDPYAPVVIGPNGSLYGTTVTGGEQDCNGSRGGCGTVFNLRPAAHATGNVMGGYNENVLHAFPGGTDPANPFSDVIFDPSGNMYGTTYIGGTDNAGTVYQLTPSDTGWTQTILYSFQNGAGSNACGPYSGVVLDPAGNLYGTTSDCGHGYGAVYMLTPSGEGWTETPLYEFTGGSDGASPFGGLVRDGSGNLYGTTAGGGSNGYGGTVFRLTQSGGNWVLNTIFSFPSCKLCGEGPWAALTMDQAGNLYGTTYENGAYGYGNVFKLSPAQGGWVYTSLHDFTGSRDGGYPYSTVIFDGDGNLYGTASTYGSDGWGLVWQITP